MKHIENQLDRSIKNTGNYVIGTHNKLNVYSVKQIVQILDNNNEERLSILKKMEKILALIMTMIEMSSIVEVSHWL